jgi:hypothetical protein
LGSLIDAQFKTPQFPHLPPMYISTFDTAYGRGLGTGQKNLHTESTTFALVHRQTTAPLRSAELLRVALENSRGNPV